jgi:glutaredoxin
MTTKFCNCPQCKADPRYSSTYGAVFDTIEIKQRVEKHLKR